jgi:hypothetical protein
MMHGSTNVKFDNLIEITVDKVKPRYSATCLSTGICGGISMVEVVYNREFLFADFRGGSVGVKVKINEL